MPVNHCIVLKKKINLDFQYYFSLSNIIFPLPKICIHIVINFLGFLQQKSMEFLS